MSSLTDRDRGLVWHPYASLDGPAPYAVHAAHGVRLTLESPEGDRTEVIDAMSSWWCAIHGYRHPTLDAAVTAQLGRFSHVMFGGLTHEPAVALAERLVELAPNPLRHVFFADSGSVSVEVAMKLAVQYQASLGRPNRQRFVALRGAYHGDTTGAMSLCDPVDGMHSFFPGLVSEQLFLPLPPLAATAGGRLSESLDAAGPDPAGLDPGGLDPGGLDPGGLGPAGLGPAGLDPAGLDPWIAQAEDLIAANEGTLAGIFVEPVLQGAGGMRVYAPACLAALRQLADRYDLLLIADEIATGFGRTGRLFGCEWAGVVPDVMCVGKALTGGYLSLAAVLCSTAVAHAVTVSDQPALLHGPTFMANPLACAVAAASVSMVDDALLARIAQLGARLASALAPARELASVADVRVLGAVGILQLRHPVDVVAVTRAAVARGVWVRPFRDLVYAMPPYICAPSEIDAIGAAMVAAVAEVHG